MVIFEQSGDLCSMSHMWEEKGEYHVKVKALDQYGEESEWSNALFIFQENINPEKPTRPTGPQEGKINTQYTYSTSSIDPDGHQVKYGWDWNGDSAVDEWSDLEQSGDLCSRSHMWEERGDYQVTVKAMDQYGEESEWSDPLIISMPKRFIAYNIFYQWLLQNLLEKFPWIGYVISN